MTDQLAVPYWRLSSFYFFYFAILGAFLPFWSLYLESLGFTAKEIGMLSSIVLITKIIAPNCWGWLADKTGQRLRIIQLGSLLAFISFLGVFGGHRFWSIAAAMAAYSFFWNAILAQFEVVTLSHLIEQPQNYSLFRVWGSIGFLVFVMGLGYIFDIYPISLLPICIASLLFSLWLSSLTIPEKKGYVRTESTSGFLSIVLRPTVLSFFMICFLMQISHGPYYTFFSIYLENYGYSKTVIGVLWSLGVVAEVALFLVMHRVLLKYSVRFLLALSLCFAAVRWLVIAYWADSLVLLVFAQLLHAFTFGSFHAVSIELIRHYFGGGHEGQGQALYGAVSFGLGGAIGAIVSGYSWEYSPKLSFVMASLACVGAIVCLGQSKIYLKRC